MLGTLCKYHKMFKRILDMPSTIWKYQKISINPIARLYQTPIRVWLALFFSKIILLNTYYHHISHSWKLEKFIMNLLIAQLYQLSLRPSNLVAVASVACSEFIQSCEVMSVGSKDLMLKSNDIVELYRKLKHGLGPILLTLYSTDVCFIIVEIFYSQVKNSYQIINNILFNIVIRYLLTHGG